jgi:hypothetical protein
MTEIERWGRPEKKKDSKKEGNMEEINDRGRK